MFGSGYSFLFTEIIGPTEPMAFVVHQRLESNSIRFTESSWDDAGGCDVTAKCVTIFVLFVFIATASPIVLDPGYGNVDAGGEALADAEPSS